MEYFDIQHVKVGSQQDEHYRSYLIYNSYQKHMLKVYIHPDRSHPKQSRIYLDRWNGEEWKRVTSMFGEVARDIHKWNIEDIRDHLTGSAMEILDGAY